MFKWMIQSYYIFTTGLRGYHHSHSIHRMLHFVLQRRNIRLCLKIAKKKLQRLPRERVHLIFYSGLSLNSSYSQKYIPGYEMFQILRNSFLESRFFEDVFVLALESFSGCVLEVLPPTASEISSPSSHRLLFVHISFVHELIRLPSRVGTIFRFLLQVTCLECVPRPALISSLAPHVRKDRRMTEGRMGR